MIVRNAARLLLILSLVFFTAAGCAETTVDKEGGYSVNFPGPAKPQVKTADVPGGGGQLVFHMNLYDAGSSVYLVSYNDYPNGNVSQMSGLDAFYQAAIQGSLKSLNGTLRSQIPYKLGSIEGREMMIDVPHLKSVERARFFLIGSRLYQAVYIGPVGSETSKAATDFLDSFKVNSPSPDVTPSTKEAGTS